MRLCFIDEIHEVGTMSATPASHSLYFQQSAFSETI